MKWMACLWFVVGVLSSFMAFAGHSSSVHYSNYGVFDSGGTYEETASFDVSEVSGQSSTGLMVQDASDFYTVGAGLIFMEMDNVTPIADNISPRIVVVQPIDGSVLSSRWIPVEFNVIDGSGSISQMWWFDTEQNNTYTNPTSIRVSAGNYTFQYYANDTAGNVGNANTSFEKIKGQFNITLADVGKEWAKLNITG